MGQGKARTSSTRPTGAKLIALLRGINVGGKNMLSVGDLVRVFTAAGCTDVRTYIQSGNVLFKAAPAAVKGLPAALARRIERAFGFRVPVVLRTARELELAAQRNPFLEAAGADTDALHVLFLADQPKDGAVSALDPNRSPPDEFAVVGREIYLRCPHGVARTRLTNAYFDAKLATTSTGRNWRTVLKLIELAKA